MQDHKKFYDKIMSRVAYWQEYIRWLQSELDKTEKEMDQSSEFLKKLLEGKMSDWRIQRQFRQHFGTNKITALISDDLRKEIIKKYAIKSNLN